MSQAMCRSRDCGLRTGAFIPWAGDIALNGSLQDRIGFGFGVLRQTTSKILSHVHPARRLL